MGSRLAAAHALPPWLRSWKITSGSDAPYCQEGVSKDGRSSSKKKKGKGKHGQAAQLHRAPRLILSEKLQICGDDGNVTLRAIATINPGELLVGVALDRCLHVRAPSITANDRNATEQAADALRKAAPLSTPLLDESDPGRVELIVLLARELVKGEDSIWAPYLRSLPAIEYAAPPSLWPWVFAADEVERSRSSPRRTYRPA
eukprot:2327533-Pleurochrysis_carterae.AAC.3